MCSFTYWILYGDNNKSLVLKTKTEDCLLYSDVCRIYKLNPKAYTYECITSEGFNILSNAFLAFANENLKSKEFI